MLLLKRFFGKKAPDPRDSLRALYAQAVVKAREPHWYIVGGVADSVDGRFEMVATMVALLVLRLEGEADHAYATALLTELFVDDIDAQLREFGVGDMVVGKRMGKLMGALGGRLGALRTALLADDIELDATIIRNLYANSEPVAEQLAHMRAGLRSIVAALREAPAAAIVEGEASW